jgi:hypothetical protein
MDDALSAKLYEGGAVDLCCTSFLLEWLFLVVRLFAVLIYEIVV